MGDDPRPWRCAIDIPLVDEIREARRAAEDARDASAQVIRLTAASMSLDVVQAQYARSPSDALPIPGDDILQEVAERWEALSDLPAAEPGPSAGIPERLRARRNTLDSMLQFLEPIANTQTATAKRLHDLQHHQADQLQDPRFAPVLEEILRVARARDDAREDLQPLHANLAAVRPTLAVFDTFISELAWVEDVEDDPRGVQGWRAATIARTLLSSLRHVLGLTNFEIALPADLHVPAAPDPDQGADLLEEVRAMRASLVRLHDAVEAQAAALRERVAALERVVEAHESTLRERLG